MAAEKTPVPEESFWSVVDRSRELAQQARPAGDPDELEALQARHAQQLLEAELSPGEIMGFAAWLDAFMRQSDRLDLWAAAYLVNGGCSDDRFFMFRAWVVSQGKEFYQRAMADPTQALAWLPAEDSPSIPSGELLLSAAPQAYEQRTGRPFPYLRLGDEDVPPVPASRLTEPWDDDDLPRLFPSLWARYGPLAWNA